MQGRVRKGNFLKGTPVTLDANGRVVGIGNIVNLSQATEGNYAVDAADGDFGNPIVNPNSANEGNTVAWLPSPAHFGNQIGGTPSTPTFSPAAGTYSLPQVVLILSAGANAIHYTLDGTNPTTASPLYQGSVRVNVSQTIKAIAVINSSPSAVGSAAYTIGSEAPVAGIAPVAHAQAITDSGSPATTAAVDTTGATLLVVIVHTIFALSGTSISDSKSNIWQPLTIYGANTGFPDSTLQMYYAYNPTVGTGHTFSGAATGGYPTFP